MSGRNVKSSTNLDWRKSRPGRKQKLAYMLETQEFADVTFRLSGGSGGGDANANNSETIQAHRFVLAMYSSVFEAMFRGPLGAQSDEIIDIPDVEPSAFRALLKYVYTGEFDRELSTSDALGVLYASKKYDICDLQIVSLEHLKRFITFDNAVSIFQTAKLLEVDDLRDDAHSFLIRNFDNVTKTEDFLNITKENLCMFINDDDTSGSELEIFLGVVRWGIAECNRQGLALSAENQRIVLKDVLILVRFLLINTEDIALQVVPTGLLTPEDSTLLFQHKVVPPEVRGLLPEIGFLGKKRNCSIFTARFYEEMAKTAYVDISAGWFNKFSVDQPMSIVSYGFYGPYEIKHEAASYEVSIKLMTDSSDGPPLAEVSKKNVVVKSREIFHVKFPRPVSIEPEKNYRAWFSLKGPSTCHGVSTSTIQEIIVPIRFTKYRQVKFTYAVTGAHQLPEISFQI